MKKKRKGHIGQWKCMCRSQEKGGILMRRRPGRKSSAVRIRGPYGEVTWGLGKKNLWVTGKFCLFSKSWGHVKLLYLVPTLTLILPRHLSRMNFRAWLQRAP